MGFFDEIVGTIEEVVIERDAIDFRESLDESGRLSYDNKNREALARTTFELARREGMTSETRSFLKTVLGTANLMEKKYPEMQFEVADQQFYEAGLTDIADGNLSIEEFCFKNAERYRLVDNRLGAALNMVAFFSHSFKNDMSDTEQFTI